MTKALKDGIKRMAIQHHGETDGIGVYESFMEKYYRHDMTLEEVETYIMDMRECEQCGEWEISEWMEEVPSKNGGFGEICYGCWDSN